MIRLGCYIFIAFQIAFSNPVLASTVGILVARPKLAPISRNVTAASLTRAEFDRLSSELQTQTVDEVYQRFSEAYQLNDIRLEVYEKIRTHEITNWQNAEVESYIRTWIVSLVLAKHGFAEAAKKQFFTGLANEGIAAERWVRIYYFSQAKVNDFLSNIATWTITRTMVQFGYLKSYEADRLNNQLKHFASTLNSNELDNHVKSTVGNEYLDTSTAKMLCGAAGFSGFALSIFYVVGPALRFASHVFEPGLLNATLGVATIVGSVGGPLCSLGSVPYFSAYYLGGARARVPDFRSIARRCEDLIRGDAEGGQR